MVHSIPMPEPYQQRQRAIVFKECPVSGATLGYFGTVVRVRTNTVRRNPDRPDLWVYRVFVPYFHAQVEVAARDLFVTGEIDDSATLDETQPIIPMCELQFDGALADDNEIVDGAYRLLGRGWDRFSFRKAEQPYVSYQFRMPVGGDRTGPTILCYYVPNASIGPMCCALCPRS